MNKEELIRFEDEIADLFENGEIKFPIHLAGTNEDKLIEIFDEHYNEGDWILSTWRNHYHWLLSGRCPDALRTQIKNHGSMHIYGDKFFTSAIVGGIAPIAVGIALALQRQKSTNKVLCFLGDMGASTGIARESITYAEGHDLPVLFIIEDNGLSVATDTKEVWGTKNKSKTIKYEYERFYPHSGIGKFILF